MNSRNFLAELKRRNVYKAAVVYAVTAWLLIQAASILLPTFEAPSWVMKVVVMGVVLGFPIAVILAWAFELTPEGIRQTEKASLVASRSGQVLAAELRPKTHAWAYVVVAGAILSVGLFFLGRYTGRNNGASSSASEELRRDRPSEAAPASSLPQKSIAVLPFENLSDDKSNAYFADGVQDQILTKLASVADLKVISRISTAKYKSKPENLKTVAQELGVATLLEGTVQRAANRVRVNVQLIDARTDTHLWAKNYDRELKDVFGVQSEVAQQIADALRAKLSPSEATALAVAPTRDPEAYDLFLQGEYELRQGESALTSPEPFYRAARFYREALSRDPNFALAAARLAHSRLAVHWYVAPVTAAELDEVKRMVDRAMTLSPNLAEAHISLGLFLYWGRRDYEAALAEFQRALEFQPNNATARGFLGYVYRRQGQWERCLSELGRAAELDPLDPKLPADMAGTYLHLRQWIEAKRAALRALAIDPQQVAALHALVFSYVNGDGDIEGAKRAIASFPGNIRTNDRGAVSRMIGYHAYLRVLERDFVGALKEAEKESAGSTEGVTPASARAAICVLAGDGAGARLAGAEARGLLETKLREREDDVGAMSQLRWVYLALGRNADALRVAHQTAASLPIEKDAYWGPTFELGLAEVQAQVGEAREAIKTLRRLLNIPAGASVSLQRLKIDPVWDPIRTDPEFQQLLALKEHVGP